MGCSTVHDCAYTHTCTLNIIHACVPMYIYMYVFWDEIDMCSYDCRNRLSMTWSQRENRR